LGAAAGITRKKSTQDRSAFGSVAPIKESAVDDADLQEAGEAGDNYSRMNKREVPVSQTSPLMLDPNLPHCWTY